MQSGAKSILKHRLDIILMFVFKCINNQVPGSVKNIFEIKTNRYSMRRQIILKQTERNTITHGIRSISYIGAKLWNELPYEMTNVDDCTLTDFKHLLEDWEGPDVTNSHFPYV